MRIWFNKVNESRRTLVETDNGQINIGRGADNDVVLKSPLVSRRHAVVRKIGEELELENVGLNSCLVGDAEVLGGERVTFGPSVKVRIWPFTISFETEKKTTITRQELEAHLRGVMADLELRIHKKLLERLDLYELEATQTSGQNTADSQEAILQLENNIADVCREMELFSRSNEALLEEVCQKHVKISN